MMIVLCLLYDEKLQAALIHYYFLEASDFTLIRNFHAKIFTIYFAYQQIHSMSMNIFLYKLREISIENTTPSFYLFSLFLLPSAADSDKNFPFRRNFSLLFLIDLKMFQN